METFGQCSESTLRRSVCDALCQPMNYSALTWRTIYSTGRHELHKVIRLLTWLWNFIFVFSVKESIPMCSFHARKTNWEIVRKSSTLGATKSASIVRVVSPEEYNLYESSMLSSPSMLVSLSMLQRSCNLTRTLFIWWLWTCTKSRCYNWTKKCSQLCCNGGYIHFK